MSKVFNLEKYIESYTKIGFTGPAERALKSGWPQELDGMTVNEIERKGFLWADEWMVEDDLR